MLHKRVLGGLCLSLAGCLCMAAMMVAATSDARVAEAAMQGDRNAVRSLLKQGVDVNAPQGDGMTALHWAALKNDAEMGQMLLSAGANLRAATRNGAYTPLFIASQNGSAAMLATLLKAGADGKTPAETGATPLMVAAASGSVDAVKLLLGHGADVNAKASHQGQTALMFAASLNRDAVIKILMQNGADARIASTVIPVASRAIDFGARGGRGQRGAPPAAPAAAAAAPPAPATGGVPPPAAAANADGRSSGPDFLGGLTPLLFAARQGHMEAATALIDMGAGVNEVNPGDKSSPLLVATVNGHYDLAKYLLDHGADPNLSNSAGGTPLYGLLNVQWAFETGYPQPNAKQEKISYLELINVLLQRGANPNARLKKELWFTAYTFDLSRVNTPGATAFWRAAQAADVDAMRLLVARGADPTIANEDGITPLMVATGAGVHGNDEVTVPAGRMPAVRYLVDEVAADVNTADPKAGLTALHNAASIGDNDMILYLVAKGARADAVGKNGETTADMANGPRQRIQPVPETVALLMLLGSTNSHKCVSC